MEDIRQYILSITAAAVICTVTLAFFGKKSPYGEVMKLICGLFLTIVLIAPLAKMQFDRYGSFFESFPGDADAATRMGTSYYEESLSSLIKSKTEAYILDKAAQMGYSVQAEVTLTDEEPPVPVSAVLSGNLPPLGRKRLTDALSEQLDIPKENLIWK